MGHAGYLRPHHWLGQHPQEVRVSAVLAEQDDEWQDGRCHFRPESMALIDAVIEGEEEAPALLLAN